MTSSQKSPYVMVYIVVFDEICGTLWNYYFPWLPTQQGSAVWSFEGKRLFQTNLGAINGILME